MFYAGYFLGVISTFLISGSAALAVMYFYRGSSVSEKNTPPIGKPFVFRRGPKTDKKTPTFVTEEQQYQKERAEPPKMTDWG